LNQLTDIQLIQQTLNGNMEAFGKLIQRYQDAVYAIALRHTMNFADAQDVGQEAFIEAYKNLHKLSEPARFPGWLRMITIRQYHRLRRKQHEATPLEELGDSEMMEISNGRSSLPHEELERNELRYRVLNAIASLPQKTGEAVTMYYIDGLSYKDIANFLSIPVSTVKGRLQMGRKRLKEELLIMVENTLKQNRPDKDFSEKVLAEIISQTKAARQRNAHDEVMQLCEKALEVLDHLNVAQENQQTRLDVLNWQSDEWLRWFGKPENAMENFQRSVQIAVELGDQELQAKSLLMQAIASSRVGDYGAMIKPVQQACVKRIDIPPELRTGHAVHRYSLIHSAKALTFINESKWNAWCEVVVPHYMRRGYEVFRDASLLAHAGQMTQILSFHLNIGHSWSGQIETRQGEILPTTRTIESKGDTVVVPAGRFEDCLRVTTVTTEPADADYSEIYRIYNRLTLCGKTSMWFARGVGLVKYCHDNNWGENHSVQLVKYQVDESSGNNYYPLSIGNHWKYERYVDWCRTRVTESYRIAAREEETVHIACAMYSDLLDDKEQLEYFQTWLDHEKASADIHGEARMQCRLGNVYARLGRWDLMLGAYRQMEEIIGQIGNAKLGIDLWLNALDGNLNTPWETTLEFVVEHARQALQNAKEIGERERQRRGLDVMTRFCILHDRFEEALKFAQEAYPIAVEDSNLGQQVYLEAQMDMVKAWMDDAERGYAFCGGTYSGHGAKLSKSEIAFGRGCGGYIHKILPEQRPYPPIYGDLLQSVLLLEPSEGKSWSKTHFEGVTDFLVEAADETVNVPAGKFNHCAHLKLTTQLRTANEGSPKSDAIFNRKKGFREGRKSMWFAPGVGIVKVEHHHANGKRTIVDLVSFHLTDLSDSYFPLAIGNQWRYEWRNEHGDLLFKEQERVICEQHDEFYLACSGYTTNVSEYRT
jgi:RNA polymerase sigma factor (sigma-70 family)